MSESIQSKYQKKQILNVSSDSSGLSIQKSLEEQQDKILTKSLQNIQFHNQQENRHIVQNQCSTTNILFQVDVVENQNQENQEIVQIGKKQYQQGIKAHEQSFLNLQELLQALDKQTSKKIMENQIQTNDCSRNKLNQSSFLEIKRKRQKSVQKNYPRDLTPKNHFNNRPMDFHPNYMTPPQEFGYGQFPYGQNPMYYNPSMYYGNQMNIPPPFGVPYYQNPTHFNNPYFSQFYQRNKFFQRDFSNINKKMYPQQMMVYKNIRISIRLTPDFLDISKNVLLLPFSTVQLNDKLCQTVLKHLKLNIKEVFLKQLGKTKQNTFKEGQIFSVKAKGLQEKYRVIYFLKSPSSSSKGNLDYYLKDILKYGMHNVFNLVDTHRQNSILIPDFQWGSMNKNQFCQVFINSLFKEIALYRKNFKCEYLQEIVIAVENWRFSNTTRNECFEQKIQKIRKISKALLMVGKNLKNEQKKQRI